MSLAGNSTKTCAHPLPYQRRHSFKVISGTWPRRAIPSWSPLRPIPDANPDSGRSSGAQVTLVRVARRRQEEYHCRTDQARCVPPLLQNL